MKRGVLRHFDGVFSVVAGEIHAELNANKDAHLLLLITIINP